jgi:hypothetical protein
VYIPLNITDKKDVNSGMEMAKVYSFKILVNVYHSVWNRTQGDHNMNMNKLLTGTTVRKVFRKILHHEGRSKGDSVLIMPWKVLQYCVDIKFEY